MEKSIRRITSYIFNATKTRTMLDTCVCSDKIDMTYTEELISGGCFNPDKVIFTLEGDLRQITVIIAHLSDYRYIE